MKNVKNHLINFHDVKLILWGVYHKFVLWSYLFAVMAPSVAHLIKMKSVKMPLHIS